MFRVAVGLCISWNVFGLLAYGQIASEYQPSKYRPYPQSSLVQGIELAFSTHHRAAQGSDNFPFTWADDDALYTAWGDGGGFGGTNGLGRVGLGVARIKGGPRQFDAKNIWGGHQSKSSAQFTGKSYGLLCVDSILYMWVVPDEPDGKKYRNHYEYFELAESSNHGKTWTKSKDRFFQSDYLSNPTFLNFGKDHTGVPRDWQGYVYTYFIRPRDTQIEHQGPNGVGLIVHKPGILFLARVRADRLMQFKSSMEFFCGLTKEGKPKWGSQSEKKPVFEDVNGVGWCVSASYNPYLKRVLLCTEHGESLRGQLGIFEAPTPWGPWSIIEYCHPSSPFGNVRPGSDLPWENNVFYLSFPTKWFDREEFVLSFTGAGNGRDNDSFNLVQGKFLLTSSADGN